MNCEFKMTGCCEGCEVADLYINTVTAQTEYGDIRLSGPEVRCRHDQACRRIWDGLDANAGCACCNGQDDDFYITDGNRLIVVSSEIRATTGALVKTGIRVNNCPICGRKLEPPKRGDTDAKKPLP